MSADTIARLTAALTERYRNPRQRGEGVREETMAEEHARGGARVSRRDFLLGAAASAGGLLFAPTLFRERLGAAPAPLGTMKIGVIGSGRIGGAVGLEWAKAGHELLFSSRHPEELADLVAEAGAKASAGLPEEAARFGDVVFVALPYAALPQVGRDCAPLMQGKVVIDCSNPYPSRDGDMAQDALDKGVGIASQEYFPGTRLVRAFNAINFRSVTSEAHRDGEKVGIPIAGDDPDALQVASDLVSDAGFDPVVVGPLARARDFQPGTPVYVTNMTAAELREALDLRR